MEGVHFKRQIEDWFFRLFMAPLASLLVGFLSFVDKIRAFVERMLFLPLGVLYL